MQTCAPSSRTRFAQAARQLISRPIWAPLVSGIVFAALIIAGTVAFLAYQRNAELATTEREIRNLSTVLGEQMDRSLQAIQTVQSGLVERMRHEGIDSSDNFVERMSTAEVHNLLRAQIKALPYVDKVALVSADGRVINFSAFWPIPKINVADRDYFQALSRDPALDQFVSKPVKDRGTGAWSIFLARKFTAKDGRFLGLVLGAIYVSYFEDYFHSILPRPDSAIALLRNDGTILARYPNASTRTVGSLNPAFPRIAAAADNGRTGIGEGADGSRAMFAALRLRHFPVLVSVSTTEAAALAGWRHEAIAVGIIAAIAIGAIAAIMYFVALSILRQIELRNLEASRRAEHAETLLRETIDSIPEGFVVYDSDDRLVMCNEAYRTLYPGAAAILVPGVTYVEILRHSLASGRVPEAVGREEEWLAERLRQHRSSGYTREMAFDDGRHILAIDRRTESGLTAGIRLDVTALRTAEAQLHQAQKMDSIGQLSGGIAHDFNNLLGTVIGNLDLLAEGIAGDANLEPFAAEALSASLRASELTKRLLAFARKQPLRPQAVDVAGQLSGLRDMLRGMLGETVTLKLDLADSLWPVLVDPVQLESAIVNLAINARDAMPNGGDITVTASNVTFAGDGAAADADAPCGDHVAIAVCDTGGGMTPEVVARAFEPFFTTKPAGTSTGLGLSMVYGFVKQSQGQVKIDSAPGRGTTVVLYLPRAKGRQNVVELPRPAMRQARLPTGREAVLLVEDNASLRQTTVRVLSDLGYRVLEAEDGPAALGILRSGMPVDLLFTDVVMPNGMSGFELAAEACRLRPGLKVLFASGFTEMAAHPRPSANGNDAPLLTKPYRKDEVAWQVRSLLDAA
jgi:signal transduction histidine kinase